MRWSREGNIFCFSVICMGAGGIYKASAEWSGTLTKEIWRERCVVVVPVIIREIKRSKFCSTQDD